MRFHGWAFAFLAASAAFGQSPKNSDGKRLEFEVASIRPSPPPGTNSSVSVGIRFDGSQMRVSQFSIKDYLAIAYNLKDYQVIAPDWVRSARFEINAKIPEGVDRDKIPEMLQSLLADRFEVKFHREKRDFSVYVLTVAKGGLKMKEIPQDAEAEAEARRAPVNVAGSGGPQGVSINLGNGSSFSMANNRLELKKIGMNSFAETLARFMDRPIVDQTELKGSYDFTLEFTPEDYRAMHLRSAVSAGIVLPPEALRMLESPGDSLFSSLTLVGLKLETRKAPLDVLVVDSARKMPTEN
jgi:uncharacterized protein (TIGR03435 family)